MYKIQLAILLSMFVGTSAIASSEQEQKKNQAPGASSSPSQKKNLKTEAKKTERDESGLFKDDVIGNSLSKVGAKAAEELKKAVQKKETKAN